MLFCFGKKWRAPGQNWERDADRQGIFDIMIALTFRDGAYGTAEICSLFKLIVNNEGEKYEMATLPGIEPGLPP
jgi:hypothetical protein